MVRCDCAIKPAANRATWPFGCERDESDAPARRGLQAVEIRERRRTHRAGGMCAGVRWSHCQKFDWTWVLRDGVTLKPDCLETMLSFASDGDMIQVRKEGPADGPAAWSLTDQCDFQGTLIGAPVTDAAGLPDERYFESHDDTSYGLIAAAKARSILLNYVGMVETAPEEHVTNRASIYLSIRNRFLNRDNLTRNGLAPRPLLFFAGTLLALINKLGEAAGMSGDKFRNALAAIDGLRDGLHKRFDRIPRL